MTKSVSFYDERTGVFSGRRFTGPARYVERNTPAGCKAIDGEFDHLSQRVDIATGEVVDYQPPRPDDDHEWNSERRRWELKAEVREARRRRSAALDRIADLERRQLRPARELAVNPGDQQARKRLIEIESEIERLRSDL